MTHAPRWQVVAQLHGHVALDNLAMVEIQAMSRSLLNA
jgi:hypothetical protein